ncbi:alpha/beta fold hydrolase [Alkalilimnicola sp. S0819]|uniref:alpha/beta fold hydrolase n=1 Tax=Alkalilimnicola sp. S0819 TaxID=2613922 RepID=UPI001261846B|nr:alpha/beta fold hydrolase [Alkalilimnicola sp. S0819]KAB7624430.1 alpha/beta fold hydrolase [Alkalilimnicola sp. S0819]MPQ16263.1 alpha/beta fold hydrolase [Alkalilimnicola sp. S0819]
MRLAISEHGQGRTLCLLPGWGMSAALLRDWAERLEGFRVLLVDLPGQGGSADVAYSLESLGAALAEQLPRDALWLGWSLGVPLLLRAALRGAPEGMLLVAGSPRFLRAPGWSGVQALALRAMRERLEAEPAAVWRQFLALLGQASPADRKLARSLLRRQPRPGGSWGLASGLAVLAQADLRAQLPHLHCPLLWLAGARDPLVPVASLVEAAAASPRGRLRVLAEAGHLPFWSHDEECAQALRALMEWIDQ